MLDDDDGRGEVCRQLGEHPEEDLRPTGGAGHREHPVGHAHRRRGHHHCPRPRARQRGRRCLLLWMCRMTRTEDNSFTSRDRFHASVPASMEGLICSASAPSSSARHVSSGACWRGSAVSMRMGVGTSAMMCSTAVSPSITGISTSMVMTCGRGAPRLPAPCRWRKSRQPPGPDPGPELHRSAVGRCESSTTSTDTFLSNT